MNQHCFHDFRRAPSRHRPSGFTLVELIVCIVVSAVISGMAGSLLWNATKMRSEVGARAELVDIAARGMEQILRYVREIPQDLALTGLAQISTANSTDLRWGVYGIRKTGTTIEITTNTGTNWYPLLKEATTLTFAYYDKNNTELTSLPLSSPNRQAVRLIKVNMTVTRSTESVALQSSIYLRAFMNEVAAP